MARREEMAGVEHDNGGYSAEVRDRLRRVRLQKGLSLDDVERLSDRQWSASALGAYERGARKLTAARLMELAAFYKVPIEALLPDRRPRAGRPHDPIVIDLTRLDDDADEERAALARFTKEVQAMRQDFRSSVLTVRRRDLPTLAVLCRTTVERLPQRLDQLGVLAQSSG